MVQQSATDVHGMKEEETILQPDISEPGLAMAADARSSPERCQPFILNPVFKNVITDLQYLRREGK